ncbi:MAG: hypothetical protein KHX46_10770, partial [Clostridiales bacterium]|nr:hypothetical protein [Clostridiales bacterium]
STGFSGGFHGKRGKNCRSGTCIFPGVFHFSLPDFPKAVNAFSAFTQIPLFLDSIFRRGLVRFFVNTGGFFAVFPISTAPNTTTK